MSSASDLLAGGLAIAGCAVAVLATLAMFVTAIDDRLHFLAPVSSIAAPLVGAGLVVENGLTLRSAQIALIVLVLAVTGPAITVAIARAKLERTRPGGEEPE